MVADLVFAERRINKKKKKATSPSFPENNFLMKLLILTTLLGRLPWKLILPPTAVTTDMSVALNFHHQPDRPPEGLSILYFLPLVCGRPTVPRMACVPISTLPLSLLYLSYHQWRIAPLPFWPHHHSPHIQTLLSLVHTGFTVPNLSLLQSDLHGASRLLSEA